MTIATALGLNSYRTNSLYEYSCFSLGASVTDTLQGATFRAPRFKSLAIAGRANSNPELRKQAISSLETKQFHCEGGSIYGLLAKKNRREAIRFIVAYQTISDYLDNLCDRSRSLDPEDFRALHDSIFHALTPDAELPNYYRFREDQDDGGYLKV